MKAEQCLHSLREIVAEAIVLGTKLSDRSYSGAIWDEANRPLWESFYKLHKNTTEFLKASQLDAISADEVFPLHSEMQQVARPRS